MGSSSKNTTKTSTDSISGTSTDTTMPVAPGWATNALQDYTNRTEQFANTNPQSYVAPLSGLQQQAATGAANLGGWNGTLGQASAAINAGTNGAAPTVTPTMAQAAQIDTGDIQRLESPYTNDVVNTTLAGYDKQAGQSMAALRASAAANNAFGGSRYGIEEGEQQASSDLGRAQTEAQLRNADYAQALQGATTDAGFKQGANLANAGYSNAASLANAGYQNDALSRQLQGGSLLGNLAGSYDALSNNDINQQAAQGATARSVDASQRTAGLSQLQALESLLQGGQFGLLTGSTATGSKNSTENTNSSQTETDNPSLLGSLGQGLGILGSSLNGLSGIGGVQGLAGLFGGSTAGTGATGYTSPQGFYPSWQTGLAALGG